MRCSTSHLLHEGKEDHVHRHRDGIVVSRRCCIRRRAWIPDLCVPVVAVLVVFLRLCHWNVALLPLQGKTSGWIQTRKGRLTFDRVTFGAAPCFSHISCCSIPPQDIREQGIDLHNMKHIHHMSSFISATDICHTRNMQKSTACYRRRLRILWSLTSALLPEPHRVRPVYRGPCCLLSGHLGQDMRSPGAATEEKKMMEAIVSVPPPQRQNARERRPRRRLMPREGGSFPAT